MNNVATTDLIGKIKNELKQTTPKSTWSVLHSEHKACILLSH